MPRAAKNSLGVVCPHSTRVLGKEGEVGTLAGLEKGVVLKPFLDDSVGTGAVAGALTSCAVFQG